MKLTLGTVQFGLDYGINNKHGKIFGNEASAILNFALKNGINFLDTARSYGDSEEVISRSLGDDIGQFNIISKASAKYEGEVDEQFSVSLKNLRCKKIYGYLLHSFNDYVSNKKIWDRFLKLRENGLAGKIGFSLYYPWELEKLLKDKVKFDLIQIPYNVFDQRFEGCLRKARDAGVEIHARSVFLQGLFFKDAADLPDNLKRIGDKLKSLKEFSRNNKIPIEALCLIFAALNKNIDKVVIGVDSLEHLKRNIDAFTYEDKVRDLYGALGSFKENDEDLLIPAKWDLKNE